jgi:hypothetical protein
MTGRWQEGEGVRLDGHFQKRIALRPVELAIPWIGFRPCFREECETKRFDHFRCQMAAGPASVRPSHAIERIVRDRIIVNHSKDLATTSASTAQGMLAMLETTQIGSMLCDLPIALASDDLTHVRGRDAKLSRQRSTALPFCRSSSDSTNLIFAEARSPMARARRASAMSPVRHVMGGVFCGANPLQVRRHVVHFVAVQVRGMSMEHVALVAVERECNSSVDAHLHETATSAKVEPQIAVSIKMRPQRAPRHKAENFTFVRRQITTFETGDIATVHVREGIAQHVGAREGMRP